MTYYRVQYLNHQPGCYGPAYADYWWPVRPDRRYTRGRTACRVMKDHASAMTAPAFLDGVTRVVEVDDNGGFVREIASRNHRAA